MVEKGQCRARVSGEELILQEGEGLFVNSEVLHACFAHGDEVCRLCSIVFHPRLVGGSLDSIFWQKYLAPLLQDSSLPFICFDARKSWPEEAADCLLRAWNACEEEKPGYEFEVRENLSRLILLLGCHHELTEKRLRKNSCVLHSA